MRRVGVGAKSTVKKTPLEEKLTKENEKLKKENAQLKADLKAKESQVAAE